MSSTNNTSSEQRVASSEHEFTAGQLKQLIRIEEQRHRHFIEQLDAALDSHDAKQASLAQALMTSSLGALKAKRLLLAEQILRTSSGANEPCAAATAQPSASFLS